MFISFCSVLKVNPVDPHAILELKGRCPKECEDLIGSSPFVTLNVNSRLKPEKPLAVTVPLPQAQVKQKRPVTGVNKDAKAQELRPQTARSTVKEGIGRGLELSVIFDLLFSSFPYNIN